MKKNDLSNSITPVWNGLFLVGCLAAAGCGQTWEADYSKLGLVNVSGTVTLDGSPLAGVTVIFECPDKTFSSGVTDGQGRYELRFDSIQKGALPGDKIVRIKSGSVGEGAAPAPDSEGGGGGEDPDPAPGQQKSGGKIPDCYNAASQLTCQVAGPSQTVNFDLKSDCSVKSPAN